MTAEDGEREPAAGRFREVVAAASRGAGNPLREFAADLFGAARVDAEWDPDGCMRAAVRRRLRRARNEVPGDGGGRELPGRR